jgi:RecB family exonuclease
MNAVVVRASSLPELFDCPARWEAKFIRKLRLKKSGAAQIGTAVHAGTAAYDRSRLEGNPVTADEAAGAVADAIHKPEEDVDWGEDRPQEAEGIAIALHDLYCREIAPRQKYAAVEAVCERLEVTDLGIVLTGTTDRVTVNEDGFGIADIKTGKTAVAADGTVETAGHAAQIAIYELLAEHSTGRRIGAPAQIIGLQAAKTDKGRRAGIGTIHSARELLIGDAETEQPGLLELAAGLFRRGDFYGNPRSRLCSEKYCPAYTNCRWRR